MTRQEEIAEKAREMYHAGAQNSLQFRAGFCTGAEWADEHPRKGLVDIEKVCEWLKSNSSKYMIEDIDFSYYAYSSLVENFRKAMEE